MKDVRVVYTPGSSTVRLDPIVWRVTRPRRLWPWYLLASLVLNAALRLIQGF